MQVEWVPASIGPNVTVTVASLDALLRDIEAHFKQKQGFSLATLNLDHVVKLRDDPAFRAAYLAHSHVTADGHPIVWLSNLAKQPVSLLAGADLIAPLAELAASLKVPVALLGSNEETLQSAADVLQMRHSGLQIVKRIAPPMGFDPSGELADSYIKQLEEAGIGMCFLALGAPKQELFAAHAASKTQSIGFVSIGAGLDFIAGTQVRAPAFMRAIAAEWLWRLMTHPRRLGPRYAACIGVLPRLLRSAFVARSGNTPKP